MSGIQVTINIFSGRPNPTWELEDAAATELTERLSRLQQPTAATPPGAFEGLGYRGIEIRRAGDPQPMLIHGGVLDTVGLSPNLVDAKREIERWIVRTAPKELERALPAKARDFVLESVEQQIDLDALITRKPGLPPPVLCPPCKASHAPAYNPGLWNVPNTQPYNNCYNYANNIITNTFAQPGRASGAMPPPPPSCAKQKPAAISDGLTAAAGFGVKIKCSYYVALVIWPNVDYHWYRQDKTGCWSHKPGSTAARNTDNAGAPIADPQFCNRGPYTIFCTYMITHPGLVVIS